MKAKTEKKINEVLENFDFDKVHKYMVKTGWAWGVVGGVPTKEQIKETAKFALVDAYNEMKHHGGFGYAYTGGFYAYCFKQQGETIFQLLFCIADYDTGI
jgi:hypothetical protein